MITDYALDESPARFHVHCDLAADKAVDIWVFCTQCDTEIVRLRDATGPEDHWAASTTHKAMEDHRYHCDQAVGS